MNEDSRTVWCGNLSDKVTEELLYELFLQVAPLERVRIPMDRQGRKSNYGFVTMKHEISVDYAVQALDGTMLFDRQIAIKRRQARAQPPRNDHAENAPNFQELIQLGMLLNAQIPMAQGYNSPAAFEPPQRNPQNHNNTRYGGRNQRQGHHHRNRDKYRRPY